MKTKRRRGPVFLGVAGALLDLHAGLYLPQGISAPPVPLVPSWPDVSGAGNNVTQAVVGLQPTHVAGPAVAFDQVDDFMGLPNIIANPATDWTIFLAFTRPVAFPGIVHYIFGNTAGATGGFLQGTAVTDWGFFDGVLALFSGEAWPPGAHVMCIQRTTVLGVTTYDLYRDSMLLASGARTAVPVDAFVLNTRGDMSPVTFGGAGQLHRVVLYPTSLSTANRNQVNRRLMDEWGV